MRKTEVVRENGNGEVFECHSCHNRKRVQSALAKGPQRHVTNVLVQGIGSV